MALCQVSDVLSNRLGWGRPFVSSLRAQQLPPALAGLEWWWRCVLRGWVCRCEKPDCSGLCKSRTICRRPRPRSRCRRVPHVLLTWHTREVACCVLRACRLLALLCAALSVAVVVAEATISPFIPNLSLFSRALHHASDNELATEMLAFVFLVSLLLRHPCATVPGCCVATTCCCSLASILLGIEPQCRCMRAGVPLPVCVLRYIPAGPLLLLPAGAAAHLLIQPAGQRDAHVPLRPAAGVQLHGRGGAAALQELLARPGRH